MNKLLNLPNLITLSRVACIPIMVFCFFSRKKEGIIAALFIFIFCSISDFLDGYLARTFKQVTKIGQILDPIADKLFVATTLILIVGFGLVSKGAMIPAAIIICREIMVSEIREATYLNNGNFNTSWMAKWKTAIQMVAICIIISAVVFPQQETVTTLGEIMLWISAVLATTSAIIYFKEHWSSPTR